MTCPRVTQLVSEARSELRSSCLQIQGSIHCSTFAPLWELKKNCDLGECDLGECDLRGCDETREAGNEMGLGFNSEELGLAVCSLYGLGQVTLIPLWSSLLI